MLSKQTIGLRRVVVTGMGIVSCLGNSPAQVLQALRQGRSGIAFNLAYAQAGLRSHVSGRLEVDFQRIDRRHRRFMGDAAAYGYLAMADAMRVALAQREQDTRRHLIDASGQGRAYADAHDTAYGAYARVEAYEALQECGEKIARAMALCSHVPQRHSAHEDSLGRMHLSEKSDAEIRAARWAFILRALATMAKECTDYAERPVVDALGALELGALSVREFLSPAQVQVMRRSGEASVPVPPIA